MRMECISILYTQKTKLFTKMLCVVWHLRNVVVRDIIISIITQPRRVWLIYTHDSRGHTAHKGECGYISKTPTMAVLYATLIYVILS